MFHKSPWSIGSDAHGGIEKYVLHTCSPFLAQIPIILPRIAETSVTAPLGRMRVGERKPLHASLPLVQCQLCPQLGAEHLACSASLATQCTLCSRCDYPPFTVPARAGSAQGHAGPSSSVRKPTLVATQGPPSFSASCNHQSARMSWLP